MHSTTKAMREIKIEECLVRYTGYGKLQYAKLYCQANYIRAAS